MPALLRRFYSELRRRHVFRVAGVYAVMAWAVVQVVATVFPLLQLPEWGARLTVLVAAAGFPLTLILAWIYDLTQHGLERTAPLDRAATLRDDAVAVAPVRNPEFVALIGSRKAAGFVGLGMLIAFAGFAAYSGYDGALGGRATRIESIAVLPFIDLSAAHDQEYFSDGITEELLNRLAQVEGLRVPARTSAFAFKGRNEDISEIARKLKVQAVVEGSVRRDGDKLRITAQLIDASTGYHLWSADFDRKAEGIFNVQDEIATAIVSALKMQIGAAEEMVPGTTDARAHEQYLLGMSAWHKRTGKDLLAALDYFQNAVEQDPSYAHAYAGLAQTYAVIPVYTDFPAEEAVNKGYVAAARALSLDARLAEAHAAMGELEANFEWDMMSAEASYRRALTFNPMYAPAHQWLAEVLLVTGHVTEARAQVAHAIALDPMSPSAMHISALADLLAGNSAGALATHARLAAAHPDFGQLSYVFSALLARRFDVANSAARVAAGGDASLLRTMREIIAGVQDPAARPAALRALAQNNATRIPPGQMALWYGALGEHGEALGALERAYRDHVDGSVPLTLVHPLLSPLRTEPRFQRIASAVGVGFPGAQAP